MSYVLIAEQGLNGLQFGLMLFLLAAGLTLVFGIMDMINLAHGSLYMIGAYLTGLLTMSRSGKDLLLPDGHGTIPMSIRPSDDLALSALERHHNTNRDVAAVGIGMGGSLAFEAAIVRKDLEAAVSYYGFPQRYFGRFGGAATPILAIYGDHEPHVPADLINQLRGELNHPKQGVQHELLILPNAARDFFMNDANEAHQQSSLQALTATFDFLEKYLKGPSHPASKPKKR